MPEATQDTAHQNNSTKVDAWYWRMLAIAIALALMPMLQTASEFVPFGVSEGRYQVLLYSAWFSAWIFMLPMTVPSGRNRLWVILLVPYFVLMFASVSAPLLWKEYRATTHEADVKRFSEAPNGLEYLNRFAAPHGLTVVLQRPQSTYEVTRQSGPWSHTPAAMDTAPPLCTLSVSPESLSDYTSSVPKKISEAAKYGILIHELGHCMDLSRDVGLYQGTSGHVHSIAPGMRKQVHDAVSYYYAQDEPSTQLWREVYADLIAVAWWKINMQSDSSALIDWLIASRAVASDDLSHMTTCWLKLAKTTLGPALWVDAGSWADRLRASPKCSM